jgi:hypothetical protein
MTDTIIKSVIAAAGIYVAYRIIKKRLPLAGVNQRKLLVDVSHPRSCCGSYKNVTYSTWEFDRPTIVPENIPFADDGYTTTTKQKAV